MNQSISSGKFPSAMEISLYGCQLIVDPKGNNHTSTSKYRPISLLSVLRKLLEKHIHITSHLESHHPIALQQWGFQAIRSTVSICTPWCLPQLVQSTGSRSKSLCCVFDDLTWCHAGLLLRSWSLLISYSGGSIRTWLIGVNMLFFGMGNRH